METKSVSFGDLTIKEYQVPDNCKNFKSATETVRDVVFDIRPIAARVLQNATHYPMTLTERIAVRSILTPIIDKLIAHPDISCLVTNVKERIGDTYSPCNQFIVDFVNICMEMFQEFKVLKCVDNEYTEPFSDDTKLHLMVNLPLNVLNGMKLEQCIYISPEVEHVTKKIKHVVGIQD